MFQTARSILKRDPAAHSLFSLNLPGDSGPVLVPNRSLYGFSSTLYNCRVPKSTCRQSNRDFNFAGSPNR